MRAVVRGDESVEPQRVAQQVLQHLRGTTGRDAVDVGVGVHHRSQAGELDRGLEGIGEQIPGTTGPGLEGRGVHSTKRNRVTQEMLAGGHHALAQVRALQGADVGDAQSGTEIRVLTERLVYPTPPGVEGHIQHR